MDKKDSQFSLSPGFLRVGLKGRTGRPGKQGKDNPARRSRAIRCRATALTVSASEAQSGQSAHCTPPHVCKRRRWVVLVCSLFVGGFVACPSFLLLTDFRSTAFPLTGCRPNSVTNSVWSEFESRPTDFCSPNHHVKTGGSVSVSLAGLNWLTAG
jgi:hypothetical protein